MTKATLPDGGKARRVYLLLREDITSGLIPAGAALPGEQKLATRFGVSRVTMRRALEALVADGLVDRRVGAGTIVRRAAEAAILAGDMATLLPQVVSMGEATEARLLAFGYGVPPEPVARALGLAAGRRVQTATRIRLSAGRPFSHLTTYVPEDVARHYSEADLATTPLFRLLERGGVCIATGHQSVTATLAAPDVADALDVATASALLAVRRVVRDAGGRGVEYLSALYRPDRFRLDMALARVGEGGARHWEPVVGAPQDDPLC